MDRSAYGDVAGWEFTVADQTRDHLVDFCGPVVVDAMPPLFVGAHACSNNTGELSGLITALRWITYHVPSHSQVVLGYDSQYVAQTTQSLLRVNSNASLILNSRAACARAASRVIRHKVEAHAGLLLNERADVLAKVGAGQIVRGLQRPPPWAIVN